MPAGTFFLMETIEAKKKAIKALIAKPYDFSIKVEDNSMLPESMADKEEIPFQIAPATIGTIVSCHEDLINIAQEDLDNLVNAQAKYDLIQKYESEVLNILCKLVWNKPGGFPEWYKPFFRENLKIDELFELVVESITRANPDFFLNSTHLLKEMDVMSEQSDTTRGQS